MAAGPVVGQGLARGAAWRWLASAALATVVGALPGFLLGALAVLMGPEIGLGRADVGVGIAVFFGASAFASIPGGRWSQRYGAARALAVAGSASGLVLLAIALFARDLPSLYLLLCLAGVANGVITPATDHAVSGGVPRSRQGAGIGFKQAAAPSASMLAGIAVPAVALTIGWRFSFGMAAVLALALLAVLPRTGRRVRRAPAGQRERVPGLLLITIAGGFGAAAATSSGMFFVPAAVSAGLAPGTAGVFLAVGSVASILARLGGGWAADRVTGRERQGAALLLAAGAGGCLLLSAEPGPLGLLAGVMLALGGGWGWPGLYNLAVLRTHPDTPAAAIGVSQLGVWVGAAAGPLTYGVLAGTGRFPLAWLMCAGLAAGAATLLLADLYKAHGGR